MGSNVLFEEPVIESEVIGGIDLKLCEGGVFRVDQVIKLFRNDDAGDGEDQRGKRFHPVYVSFPGRREIGQNGLFHWMDHGKESI